MELSAGLGAAIVLRGDIALTRKTDLMEKVQDAQFRASAAAAGCTIAKPEPDDGIDWIVTHRSSNHLIGRRVNIEVQLRSTSQLAPPLGDDISFPLDTDTFDRLTEESYYPRLLIVCILPEKIEDWIYADRASDIFQLRHLSYWFNVRNSRRTGVTKTTVHIPTTQIFDDRALCDIMRRVGRGEVP